MESDYGGTDGLCERLRVDKVKGLPNDVNYLTERRGKYGPNTIPKAASKSFFRLVFDASRDPTLIILVVAGFISLILSFYEPGGPETADQNDASLQLLNATQTNVTQTNGK